VYWQAATEVEARTGKKDPISKDGPVNQSTLEVEENDKWHVIPEQSVAFAVAKA
jgi:hypothetical protein